MTMPENQLGRAERAGDAQARIDPSAPQAAGVDKVVPLTTTSTPDAAPVRVASPMPARWPTTPLDNSHTIKIIPAEPAAAQKGSGVVPHDGEKSDAINVVPPALGNPSHNQRAHEAPRGEVHRDGGARMIIVAPSRTISSGNVRPIIADAKQEPGAITKVEVTKHNADAIPVVTAPAKTADRRVTIPVAAASTNGDKILITAQTDEGNSATAANQNDAPANVTQTGGRDITAQAGSGGSGIDRPGTPEFAFHEEPADRNITVLEDEISNGRPSSIVHESSSPVPTTPQDVVVDTERLTQHRFNIHPASMEGLQKLAQGFEGIQEQFANAGESSYLVSLGFFGSTTKGTEYKGSGTEPGSDFDFFVLYDSSLFSHQVSNSDLRYQMEVISRRLERQLEGNGHIEDKIKLGIDGGQWVDISGRQTEEDLSVLVSLARRYARDTSLVPREGLLRNPTIVNLLSRFLLSVGDEVYESRKYILDRLGQLPDGEGYFNFLMKALARFERPPRDSENPPKVVTPPFESLPQTIAEGRAYFLKPPANGIDRPSTPKAANPDELANSNITPSSMVQEASLSDTPAESATAGVRKDTNYISITNMNTGTVVWADEPGRVYGPTIQRTATSTVSLTMRQKAWTVVERFVTKPEIKQYQQIRTTDSKQTADSVGHAPNSPDIHEPTDNKTELEIPYDLQITDKQEVTHEEFITDLTGVMRDKEILSIGEAHDGNTDTSYSWILDHEEEILAAYQKYRTATEASPVKDPPELKDILSEGSTLLDKLDNDSHTLEELTQMHPGRLLAMLVMPLAVSQGYKDMVFEALDDRDPKPSQTKDHIGDLLQLTQAMRFGMRVHGTTKRGITNNPTTTADAIISKILKAKLASGRDGKVLVSTGALHSMSTPFPEGSMRTDGIFGVKNDAHDWTYVPRLRSLFMRHGSVDLFRRDGKPLFNHFGVMQQDATPGAITRFTHSRNQLTYFFG